MTLPYQLFQSKIKQQNQNQQGNLSSSLSVLRGLKFWIWSKDLHLQQAQATNGLCCFNHYLGLPIKNKEYSIFDFQKLIFDCLQNNQNIWIKKARGIGVTTFMIRYLVWKILSSTTNELDGKSIFIISGTREEFANYVKKKMEDLFLPRFDNITFDSKYTELWINKTWIKVMPTKNIKDVRGYMDVAYLFIDEADHFDKSIQEELEPAITAYEEKSKGKTIMVSTPNQPGGLFERIEKDPNSKYAKLFLDYTYGLDKIYDRAFIEKKKLEPEFEREYNLKYLGRQGNLLSPTVINASVELGETLKDIPVNQYCIHSLGLDPSFGSSAFGIVLTEHLKEQGKIRVLYSEAIEGHPNPQDIVNLVFDFYKQFRNLRIFVDGSARGFITSLKIAFNEETDYEKAEDVSIEDNKVIPVNFGTQHKSMISHLATLFNNGYVGIAKEHDKLILSLKTA